MPLLKAHAFVEFYKGHPSRGGELLAPWVNQRRTAHAQLYGETRHTSQMWTAIEKDHLDQIAEFVDFVKAINSLRDAITLAAANPNPATIVQSALAARGAYDEFRGFAGTFGGRIASNHRTLSVTWPDPRFDSLLIRFWAMSEEDDLPVDRTSPAAQMHRHTPPELAPAITLAQPVLRRPGGGEGKFVDLGGKRWDRFRSIEWIVDFRRLEHEFGDGMYGPIAFVQEFAMGSIFGGLAVEQLLELQVNRPPRPVVTRFPRAAAPGTSVEIHGEHLLGAREVRLGSHPARITSAFADRVTVVVPELPRLDPFEEDPIVVHTPGGESAPTPGVFRILRRLEDLRSLDQEEGRLLRAGETVRIDGTHLHEVTGVQWIGGTGLGGETTPETGRRFPATWRYEREQPGEFGVVERLVVAVPLGLPAVANLAISTPAETKTLGAFFVQGSPVISAVQQIGLRRELDIRGMNLQPLERVQFGETEATVVSASSAMIRIRVPGTAHAGHVVVRAGGGTAVSSDVVTIARGGPPPPAG